MKSAQQLAQEWADMKNDRKSGSSRLKYDKAKRTIVTVTDNLEMCASCIQPVAKR